MSKTCAVRALAKDTLDATCVDRDVVTVYVVRVTRCIDVPPNKCRMMPIDVVTGELFERKFTVKKEGVEEKWW
jgi:hypothetical protein